MTEKRRFVSLHVRLMLVMLLGIVLSLGMFFLTRYNIHDRAARDFVNGYERSIWLDFNVDGYILDLMEGRENSEQ